MPRFQKNKWQPPGQHWVLGVGYAMPRQNFVVLLHDLRCRRLDYLIGCDRRPTGRCRSRPPDENILCSFRLDVSSPADIAWPLVPTWPGSERTLLDGAGHADVNQRLCQTTDRFSRPTCSPTLAIGAVKGREGDDDRRTRDYCLRRRSKNRKAKDAVRCVAVASCADLGRRAYRSQSLQRLPTM